MAKDVAEKPELDQDTPDVSEKAKKAKPAKPKEKKSIFKRFTRFFKDLKSEIKKVVWPSKKQVKNNTFVVLCFMAVAGVFLWILDFVLTTVLKMVFGS